MGQANRYRAVAKLTGWGKGEAKGDGGRGGRADPRDSSFDGVLEGSEVEEGLGLLTLAQLMAVGLAGRSLRPPPSCCLCCRRRCSL